MNEINFIKSEYIDTDDLSVRLEDQTLIVSFPQEIGILPDKYHVGELLNVIAFDKINTRAETKLYRILYHDSVMRLQCIKESLKHLLTRTKITLD